MKLLVPLTTELRNMQNTSFGQKIIFSQITSFVPWYQFDKIVDEFGGDYRYKKFKSRDHLLVMIFAQLTYREGLRAIESSLNSQRAKLYRMGIRCEKIARNTIAKANEVRDYRIYEKLANILTARAKELYSNEKGFSKGHVWNIHSSYRKVGEMVFDLGKKGGIYHKNLELVQEKSLLNEFVDNR